MEDIVIPTETWALQEEESCAKKKKKTTTTDLPHLF